MLFVFEQYLLSRKAKVRAWEKSRDEWINADTHGYRRQREYDAVVPYPVFKWKPFLSAAVPIAIGAHLLIGLLFFIISTNEAKPDTAKKEDTSQSQSKDTTYKVGDKVQVVYGDFKNSVGVITKIGDSGVVLKLTESTFTKEIAMAETNCDNCRGAKEVGNLLQVDSSDNLVPYKEVK